MNLDERTTRHTSPPARPGIDQMRSVLKTSSAAIRQGGKTTNTLKSLHICGAPYKKSTIFRRAEGANENYCFLRPGIWYLLRALSVVHSMTCVGWRLSSNSRGGASHRNCPPRGRPWAPPLFFVLFYDESLFTRHIWLATYACRDSISLLFRCHKLFLHF